MRRTTVGRIPVDIDFKVRQIMKEANINYPSALREYVNRRRGIIKWDL